MAKTTEGISGISHSAGKNLLEWLSRKKGNSNAFLTILFLALKSQLFIRKLIKLKSFHDYTTLCLQKQMTCAPERISYDQPHSMKEDGKGII